LTLRFFAISGNPTAVLKNYLQDSDDPLFRNLFIAAQWLQEGGGGAEGWGGGGAGFL